MRRHFSTLALALAVILVAGGCRKRKGSSSPPASGPEAAEAAAAMGLDAKALPSQQVLYEAITKYMTANQGRAAKGVDELVQRGFLKALPPLPPGKRYELDQRAAVLSIVDN